MSRQNAILLFAVLLSTAAAAFAEDAKDTKEADKKMAAAATEASAAAPPIAPITSISEGIDKAGRQRMLTQRIVKCYAQKGQDIRYLVAAAELDDSVRVFERQLQQLKGFAQDAESQRLLTLIEQRWLALKQIAVGEVSRTQAEALRILAEQTLTTANQLVLLLEERSGSNQGHLVNLAGRQRMLTQRMANLYLLMAWGFEDPGYLADYKQAVREFEAALFELKTAGENTPEINQALQQVSSMWQMFKFSSRVDQGEYAPSLVTRLLDKILLRMNEVTGMYASLQSE